MKKIYIFIFIIYGQLICAGDYSVTIRVEDYSWRSGGNEWECMLYADLYYDGELLEPSNEFKYAWYEKRVTASEYSLRKEGYGQNYTSRYIDGEPFEFFDNKVFVEGTNFTVNAYALVGRAEYPQEIQLYGYREDNTEIIESEYIKVFMNPNWKGFGIPLGPNETDCWLSLNKNEILWTDNRIIENPKEKYHHWNYDNNQIQNHHTFFIDDNIHEFIIHTKQIVSAHLQCRNYSSGNNKIEFLDPWYPDRNELGGIKQNAGTHQNAYWHGYINLEIELDNEDEYKGVFKNLNPIVNDNYYSVRSPVEPTVNYGDREVTFFRVGGWQTNSACTLTTPNNISNGYYETPVIFTADNAEIKVAYKGHLASTTSQATGYNGGRRLSRTDDGTLHLVYEDDYKIWYTSSTDNGLSWTKEIRISEEGGYYENPSIASYDNLLYVVWNNLLIEADHSIFYAHYNGNWSAQQTVQEVYLADDHSMGNTIPVIAVLEESGSPLPVVVYRTVVSGGPHNTYLQKMVSYKKTGSGWQEISIPDYGSNPSLCADSDHSKLGLAYEDQENIYYNELTESGWGIRQCISGAGTEKNACVALHNGTAHVVWEGTEGGTEAVYYRELTTGDKTVSATTHSFASRFFYW